MTENKRFSQKDEDDWEILDRNKHFAYAHSGYQAGKIIQELNELVETNRELYKENKELKKENRQLKQSVNNLKDTIIKITIAYQRKYDRSIVDLVHEVYDEDITDLIKELSE